MCEYTMCGTEYPDSSLHCWKFGGDGGGKITPSADVDAWSSVHVEDDAVCGIDQQSGRIHCFPTKSNVVTSLVSSDDKTQWTTISYSERDFWCGISVSGSMRCSGAAQPPSNVTRWLARAGVC